MNLDQLKPIAANLRHAARDKKPANIGGGIFTPEELKNAADALDAIPSLFGAIEIMITAGSFEAGGKTHLPGKQGCTTGAALLDAFEILIATYSKAKGA